jgi:hypothetical protein
MAFEAKSKHEGFVYRHLDRVQGELIPVYLGNISLVRPYFLDVGVWDPDFFFAKPEYSRVSGGNR